MSPEYTAELFQRPELTIIYVTQTLYCQDTIQLPKANLLLDTWIRISLPAMRVILRHKYRTSIKDHFQNGFPKIQRNVWDLK